MDPRPTYDLAILGGGPAGAAAAVYAARKRLRSVLITKDWAGQSSVSESIENWIGEAKIGGFDLAKKLEAHAKAYAPGIVDMQEGAYVTKAEALKSGEKGFAIATAAGASFTAKTLLVATGSSRRKLDVPGAAEYDNKGLTYCATCDGPLYADKDVAVVGGGNAGFESAAQLMAYCKSVTLLNRSASFKADPGTVEAVSKNPRVNIIMNAIPKAVKGDRFVTAIAYTDAATGADAELPVAGIFVEIGSIPNSGFLAGIAPLDAYGRVPVDARTQRAVDAAGAAIPGVWAAGDVTDGLYHQNNIAAGDAVKAVEDIYLFLNAK